MQANLNYDATSFRKYLEATNRGNPTWQLILLNMSGKPYHAVFHPNSPRPIRIFVTDGITQVLDMVEFVLGEDHRQFSSARLRYFEETLLLRGECLVLHIKDGYIERYEAKEGDDM